MDVTREAFFDLLPELEDAIEKALFISIDGEFTGIDNGSSLVKNTPYDPPHEVYRRQFQKALDFLLIQFGMCIFYYDDKTEKYTHQAYNFYVFPQSNNQYEPDPIFKCQSSSLAFLAYEGFDFNKLFREGIPYLNQDEEYRRRKALEEKWKAVKKPQNKVASEMPVPKDKDQYLKEICNQVKNFLTDENEPESLSLNPSNPFIRKLVYQEIEKEFGDSVCLRTDQDKKDKSTKQEKGIFVFRGEDKDKVKLFDEEAEKREWREFETSIGFSHVIKLLSKSNKLIVGHNMLLDVCHTVNRFVNCIPDNYSLFKDLLHKTFPRMIDTKTMTSLPPFQKYFQSTMLQTVFETLSVSPFKIPECGVQVPGRGYSTLKAKEHEAGYDAYVTGLCYLSLCDFLQKDGLSRVRADKIAEDYLNKVHIWVMDAPYIHIGEEDPKPSRQHVFHLEYPHEWKRSTIARLFKSVGPVNVSFLTESRAYVALVNKQNASLVKSVSGGVITQYDKFHSNRHDEPDNESATKTRQGNHSKAGKSNQKQSSTGEEASLEIQSNFKSRKRANRNKNKSGEVDESSETRREGLLQSSSEKLSENEQDKKAADTEPPPLKIRKEFDMDDNWN